MLARLFAVLVVGIALSGCATEADRQLAAAQPQCRAQGKEAKWVPRAEDNGPELRVWSEIECLGPGDFTGPPAFPNQDTPPNDLGH
jgi:hypothetical protein